MKKLFLFYIIFIMACTGKNHHLITQQIIQSFACSTVPFIKEIPITKKGTDKGEPDLLYRFTIADARQLKLDDLEKGYNLMEVRIWLGHSLAKEKQVVILRNNNGQWHGRVVTFVENHFRDSITGMQTGEKVIEHDRYVYPSGGWINLLEKLQTLQITNLPKGDDQLGYNACGADGIPYYFEVATANKYRFYYYCDPDEYWGKYWQAKNVLEFAGLLEKEFGFEYTR